MVAYHKYDGDKIPIITRKNGHRALYNMSPDEIDRMRCDTVFSEDGECMEPGGFQAADFESSGIKRLSEDEIREAVEYQKKNRSSLYHLLKDLKAPCEHQNGHGYCWAYGLVAALVAAIAFSLRRFVRLDAHSVAAGYMKGRDRGGWASMALEWIAKYGVVPFGVWPKHSRNHRLWEKAEIKEAAAKFRAPETFNIRSGDMQALDSCLAANIACGMGLMWWGHLVCFYAVDYSPEHGKLRLMRNSHGSRFGRDGWAWVAESPARHGGGSAVRVGSTEGVA